MPLRDHFHPPVSDKSSWEELHGGWPMTMVMELGSALPPDFVAVPRVHLGTFCEIDVCAFERQETQPSGSSFDAGEGGVAVATWAPPEPTMTADTILEE